MTANSRLPCAINLETNKPYTKHKHIDQLITFMYHEKYAPVEIRELVTKRCIRPGCRKNIWVQP